MNTDTRKEIIDTSWALHSLVESSYLAHPAKKGEDAWLDKQRLLLADMALHLLQTAVNPEGFDKNKLTNNVHAIMTIVDQFLPQAGLKQATASLYSQSSVDTDK